MFKTGIALPPDNESTAARAGEGGNATGSRIPAGSGCFLPPRFPYACLDCARRAPTRGPGAVKGVVGGG